MYQVVEDLPFELVVERTTLETCTDVVYESVSELIEVYGELVRTMEMDHYIKITPLVQFVKKQFNSSNTKEVTLCLSDSCKRELSDIDLNREIFKPNGFMYSKKFDVFKRYKEPKAPKVVKKKVPGKVYQILRSFAVDMVNSRVNKDFGVELVVSGGMSKENQLNVVKLGRHLGHTFDKLLEYKGTDDEWYELCMNVPSNVNGCIDRLVKEFECEEFRDEVFNTFKQWYETE